MAARKRKRFIFVLTAADAEAITALSKLLGRSKSDTVRLAVSVLAQTLQAQGVKPDEK